MRRSTQIRLTSWSYIWPYIWYRVLPAAIVTLSLLVLPLLFLDWPVMLWSAAGLLVLLQLIRFGEWAFRVLVEWVTARLYRRQASHDLQGWEPDPILREDLPPAVLRASSRLFPQEVRALSPHLQRAVLSPLTASPSQRTALRAQGIALVLTEPPPRMDEEGADE